MTDAPLPSPADQRRAWMTSIRAALGTAEQVAASLSHQAEVGVSAQALLHRLAAIRAEVDLIEARTTTAARPRSFRPPAADRRRPQTRA